MIKVNSTHINQIGYDPKTKVLQIAFHNGGLYHYQGVSNEDHKYLIGAKSIGKHFTKFIKSKYLGVKQ